MKEVLDLIGVGSIEEEILAEYDFVEPKDFRARYQCVAAQAGHAFVRLQAT